MIDTVIFTSPYLIAIVAFISLLHIASAALTALSMSDGVLSVIFIAINAIAHICLFALALIEGAMAEEIFLAVMISGAVGMLSVYVSERIAATRAAKNTPETAEEEEEYGI